MARKIIKPHLDDTVHTIDEKNNHQDLSYSGNSNLEGTTYPMLNPKHDYDANPVTYEDPDGNENNFFFPELEEVFPDAETRYTKETSTPATSAPATSTPITNTNTYGDYLASQEKSTNDYYTKLLQQYEDQNKALIAQINKNKADALSYAEGQKRAAEEAAKIQRERDMVDAANAYEKNKATYGAKAEALADMGLTGGGYSDYLAAQAYAAQRGDVQAAIARHTESNRLANNAYNDAYYQINSDANKAILDAQSTTNQLKNAAEASKHSELTAIESNKATYNEGAFQSVLEGINNGTISKSQIENLASLYGMSDSQKQAWLDAADKVAKDTEELKAEAEASYKSGIFNDILGKISSGAISADQIDILANAYGMSDEQKQIWLDAASKYGTEVEEETKNTSTVNTTNAMYNIDSGAYYSTEALDRMVDTKEISPEDRKKIEEYQTKAINNKLDYYFTKGDVASATATAEELYASKLIGKDKYQETYFKAELKNIQSAESSEEVEKLVDDIDKLRKEGKLTSSDAENLKKYLASMNGSFAIDPQNYSVDGNHKWITISGNTVKVEVNGKTYSAMYSAPASNDQVKALTETTGTKTPNTNTVAFLDGNMFIYNDGWRKYSVSKDVYEYLKDKVTGTIPTHTK